MRKKLRAAIAALVLSGAGLIGAAPAHADINVDTTGCGVGARVSITFPVHIHVLC